MAEPLVRAARGPSLAALEARRVLVQRQLDASRSPVERNAAGQFATPAPLAEALVRRCVIPGLAAAGPLRVLEPAFGTGALVSALLRHAREPGRLSVRGVERDPRVLAVARALWAPRVELVEGDFTQLEPGAVGDWRADTVLANPPYVRHHLLAPAEKRRLQRTARASLGLEVSGLAGLYVHFVLRAHSWMAPGALGVWLVPAEWMDVGYGAALRRYLTSRVTLLGVHRFGETDAQFEDALVSSSVVWFREGPPRAGTRCTLSTGPRVDAPELERSASVRELAGAAKWGGLLRPGSRASSVAQRARRFVLGDLVRVSRGVATGGNGFFVRPRAELLALGVSPRFLRPLLPSPRQLPSASVESEADGWPRLEAQPALLDCDLEEEDVRSAYPALHAYLESAEGQRVRRGYLCRRRRPWYTQERRDAPPIVASYMGRGRGDGAPLRFVWNRSRAIATNAWLLLVPRPELADALARRPALAGELAAFLATLDRSTLAAQGRVYGGGLHKLEPSELGSLDVTGWVERVGLAERYAARRAERCLSRA